MTPPFKIVLPAFLIAGCALLASCDSDPLAPSGHYVAPTYTATIESMRSNFQHVCGTGPDDVYALGNAILHYDGSQWVPVKLPAGYAPWGSARMLSDGSLVVWSERKAFVFSDGVWSSTGEAPDWIRFAWGRTKDDLYVRAGYELLHHDGTNWTAIGGDLKMNDLYDMSGSSDGKLVMSGWPGRVELFDGTGWTSLYFDSLVSYQRVVMTPSGRVFVSGGGMFSPGAVFEIIGSSSVPIIDQIHEGTLQANGESISIVAHDGMAREYSAGVWRDVALVNSFSEVLITSEEVFAVASNGIWHGDASGGELYSPYEYRGQMMDAVAIGDAIYVVGEKAFRYQDGGWTDLNKQLTTLLPANGIDGRKPTDIYAVGDGMVLHYDGTRWAWINSGLENRLAAVWVEANGKVVAVGSNDRYPVVVDFDGEEWTEKEIPIDTYGLTDVVRIGNTIYVCGAGGLVGRREGHTWYFARPTGASLRALWGSDEEHVYAATSRPNEILFFNGSRWKMTRIEGVELNQAVSVWGTSPSDLFVLDYDGSLVHFNGSAWNAEDHFLTEMRAVAGTRRELLAVGRTGMVSYRK